MKWHKKTKLSLKDPRPLAPGMLSNATKSLLVSYVQSFDMGMQNNINPWVLFELPFPGSSTIEVP